MEGTQDQKSTHHTLIIKEAEQVTQEVAMNRAIAIGKEEEERVDNHIQRHQTLTEARPAITEKVVTLQDAMEIKLHPTPTMKRQIEVVIEEVGKGTVTVADIVGIETLTIGIETVTLVCIEIVEDQDHRAQVVRMIGGLEGIGEEGDVEEVVEVVTRVGGLKGIGEEGENEGVVEVGKEENGKKIWRAWVRRWE